MSVDASYDEMWVGRRDTLLTCAGMGTGVGEGKESQMQMGISERPGYLDTGCEA